MKKITLLVFFIFSLVEAQTPIYKFSFDNSVSEANDSEITFQSSTAVDEPSSEGSTNQSNNSLAYYTEDRFGNSNSALSTNFENNTSYTVSLPNIPQGSATRSVSVWISYQELLSLPNFIDIFNYGNQSINQSFGLRQLTQAIRSYGWANDIDSPGSEFYGFNNLAGWYHFVMTFDGTNVQVFRNGHLIVSGTKPEWNTNGTTFRLNVGSPLASGFGVAYDDLEIYDVVLTEEQIREMYVQQSNDTLLDEMVTYFSFDEDFTSSDNEHDFSFVGGAASANQPTQVPGFFGNAYSYNDSMMANETLSTLVNNDNVSFSFWSKTTTAQPNFVSLVGMFNGFNFIRDQSSLNNALLVHGNASFNQLQGFETGFTADILNEWTHHAVVFVKPSSVSENRELRYYNNGVLVRSFTVTSPMHKVHNKVSLGRSFNDTGVNHNGFFFPLNGTVLDEFMIFNKALSQTEILALSFMDADALSQPSCPSGNVVITSQADADALADCSHVSGNLSIFMDYEILDFTPLQNITTIDGNLTFVELGNEGVLNVLPNLTFIGGDFAMYGNDLITSVEGFSNLTNLNSLIVSDSFNLTSFNAFQNLQSVNSLIFDSCQSLSTIQEFTQLAEFNSLSIETTGLTNLNFLSNVSTVLSNPFYNAIIIQNNNSLSDISALDDLTVSDFNSFDEIKIQNNPLLSNCAVDLVCSYLASTETEKTISNNGEGCESVTQVSANCQSLSLSSFENTKVSVYPNPFIDSFTVTTSLLGNSSYEIFDMRGNSILKEKGNGEQLLFTNLSRLSKGIYFLKITNENGFVVTKKLVK